MTATIIDGRAVGLTIRDQVATAITARLANGQRPPSLHVVLCGDDPASATYVRIKSQVAPKVGIDFTLHTPPATTTTAELVALVHSLNADAEVDAILVQIPLPAQIDERAVLVAVDPAKDADGFHPLNFGILAQGGTPPALPGTPAGCMELLRHYDIPLRGARAVVIGRSTIVGRPMALLLIASDATVTVCHSRTVNLAAVCREADILVSAIGKPGFVDASFVKPGACVIDVGTTPIDGTVHGDVVRTDVEPVAGWLSPVPGGVGPMTIAMLMRNTLALAAARTPMPQTQVG